MSKEVLKMALEALEGLEALLLSMGLTHLIVYGDAEKAITNLQEALAEQPAQEKDWGAVGDAHIAAIKKSSKAMVEDAAVRAVHKVMAEFEAKSDERLMEPPTEFFTHCVDQPHDWSEWVCPDPKGYLMKCCDCGLVHEAEFGVVRYKSETEREDCDMVDDPNLQAVFRMRRSEQWSPADMAHRAGGLTMEQPAQQEPVAIVAVDGVGQIQVGWITKPQHNDKLYTSPPQRKPLTSQERDAQRWRFLMENSYDSQSVTQFHVWEHSWEPHSQTGEPTEWKQRVRGIALIDFIDRAIEVAHGIKENT